MAQRTEQQNKSLHKYCELLAKELNDKGLTMQDVLKHGTVVPWTEEIVKEYAKELAEIFNNAGVEVFGMLEDYRPVKWTMPRVKDHLWRPYQRKMFKKESSRDLSTTQVSDVYMVLDQKLAEKFGISVEWPSKR